MHEALTRTPFVAFGMLVIGVTLPGVARAVDPVTYADVDGICGGLTPCYMTISEAVFNAADPDGFESGDAAQIFVFPGVYPETVVLNELNLGTEDGDVQLITVDEAGVPTPGTATVNPGVGTAIVRFGGAILGHVLVDGFIVQSGTGSGLDIGGHASVIVSNVVANGNGGTGIRATNFAGMIAVSNCTANDNAGTGIAVSVGFGSVQVTNAEANNNGARGISATSSDGSVTVTTVTASGNVTDGLWTSALTSVSITSATADGNGDTGIRVEADSASVQSSHANDNDYGVWMTLAGIESANVRDTIADQNAIYGIRISNTGGSAIVERCSASNGIAGVGLWLNVFGPVLVRDVTADENGSAGMEIQFSELGATLENCSADANIAGHGVRIDGSLGLVRISDTTADGNGTFGIEVPPFLESLAVVERSSTSGNISGFGMSLTVVGDVLITDTVADGNGAFGILAVAVENNVTIRRCSANGNLTAWGISTNSLLNTTIADTTANQNGTFGMRLDLESGDATIQHCNADGNLTAHGIRVFMPLGDGGAILVTDTTADGNASFGMTIEAESGGPASVQRCRMNDNLKAHGLAIRAGGSSIVADTVANGNDDAGMMIQSLFDAVTIERCTASENSMEGFDVSAGLNIIVRQVTAIGNQIGLASLGGNELTVEDSRFQRNLVYGVYADGALMGRMNGSILCNNEIAGVFLATDVLLAGEGNWWGDATGPTHPNNIGGVGDTVRDGGNGADGTVLFDPWIDTVTASVNPAAANVGDMVDVTFQFSDAAKSVFLGEGPGDPNTDPPFELTTDNGDLTASSGKAATVKEFVNQPSGVLGVIAEPSAAGPVNVMLTGPCGLDGMVLLQAIAADLSIDKSDDADPVTAGDNIVYKLIVTNIGPDAATDVSVGDTLPAGVDFVSASATQGSCSEASGVVTCNLGSLASGASVEVTVQVKTTGAGSITNTATVSANEGDPNTSNNTSSETTTVNAPAAQPEPEPEPEPQPMEPGEQMPPASQPTSNGTGSMFGFCGFGTLGMLPWMVMGLGVTRRVVRRQTQLDLENKR